MMSTILAIPGGPPRESAPLYHAEAPHTGPAACSCIAICVHEPRLRIQGSGPARSQGPTPSKVESFWIQDRYLSDPMSIHLHRTEQKTMARLVLSLFSISAEIPWKIKYRNIMARKGVIWVQSDMDDK